MKSWGTHLKEPSDASFNFERVRIRIIHGWSTAGAISASGDVLGGSGSIATGLHDEERVAAFHECQPVSCIIGAGHHLLFLVSLEEYPAGNAV